MKSLLYTAALLPLVACYGGERADTGQCPVGETCSPATPFGLQFVGNQLADEILITGPAPTAVGGTQNISLQYNDGDGIFIALDLPYTADDDGGLGVTVGGTMGSIVTVDGVASATNYLRILDASDGTLFDRKELTGAKIDSVALVAADAEQVPFGMTLAWATGDQLIGVALSGQVQEATGPTEERVIDTSMQLGLAGAERMAWDTLHVAAATVGSYPIAITAGDQAATSLTFDVVDHADAIAAIEPVESVSPNDGGDITCFQATNAGRFVVGLQWSYTVDGVALPGTTNQNCVLVQTAKTTGTVAVEASAGGQTMTLAVAVAASTRTAPHAQGPRSPAGERAALVK